MDLVLKVGLFAIIIALVFITIYLVFGNMILKPSQIGQQQAEQFVINDLNKTYPNANITIINESRSAIENNSWNIVLRIILNQTKVCPTLFIIGFDYPATGLEPSIYNMYTDKCIIYGISNNSLNQYSSYIISTPQVAVVRAYNLSGSLKNYVNTYGYNNVSSNAKFYHLLNASLTPLNKTFSNIWIINLTAANAKFSQFALLNTNGTVINNFTIKK